jgi:hypothetical protein
VTSIFDPKLGVTVSGNEIIITLHGTSYAVTYFKRKDSPGLFAKDIVHEDDPRVPMTSAEFLAKAWKVANEKARELVDRVKCQAVAARGGPRRNPHRVR